MFDSGKLIECVHGKPALWDKHLEEYSDRNLRERCWIQIAEALCDGWPEIDAKEKDAKVKNLKNKWRHIRDNFMKDMNQGKSGAAAPSKRKKYIYADALTFLLNTLEKRPSSGNLEKTSVVEEDSEEGRPANDSDIFDDVQQNEETQTPKLKEITQEPKRKVPKMSPFQNQMLKHLSTSSQLDEDPDRLFILSMLSDYKKLNEDEKLDFKVMNLQFFREVRRRKAQHLTPPHTPQPKQRNHKTNSTNGVSGPSQQHYPSKSGTSKFI